MLNQADAPFPDPFSGLVGLKACVDVAGKARGLPNDWHSAQLEGPLKALFPNVRVENDGIAAMQAERRWGALQNAGHAEHMFASTNLDALCGCGNVGDLEGLVAGNAIPRRFASQGYADSASLLIAS